MEDKELDNFMAFFTAADENIKTSGERYEWECPLCGGVVVGTKASFNGHIHAGCTKCNTVIMQ